MSFSPIIPFGGLLGWQFLERTLPRQLEAFTSAEAISREKQYFSENIGKIENASQLVEDRRLLEVSLTAFGLEDDLQNKFLIKKVLEDGTLDPDALSNRFSDKRYFALSKAFGFGALEFTALDQPSFANSVLDSFERRSFEAAVGEKDPSLRLAMSLEDEVSDILDQNTSETSSWLSVLGNPPLKAVFETALRTPAGAGQADLDSQIEFLSSQLEAVIGVSNFSDLAMPQNLERLRQNYLLMTQVSTSTQGNGNSIALQLLQSGSVIRV